jgi:hypothetical protein
MIKYNSNYYKSKKKSNNQYSVELTETVEVWKLDKRIVKTTFDGR